VTQTFARHGTFPRSLAKENRHGAPTFALIVTGAITSAMLLSNYSDSIAGMFGFLNIVVTAGNLPFYLACSLAVLLSSRQSLLVRAAALGAFVFCAWATIGIEPRPLAWAVCLAAAGLPVYWFSRQQAGGDRVTPLSGG